MCTTTAQAMFELLSVFAPAMILPVALGELVQCQWCSALMAKTEADMLCVVCSSRFSDRLFPADAGLWDESGIPQVIFNEFEDSKYGSEVIEDERSEASTKDPIDAGTGGCEECDNSQPNCKMYEKMTAVWHLEKQALPLADDAWCMLCHLNALSRCWVDHGGSLVKFGFPEIRALCRAFVWDVPKGFIVINLARRKVFSISAAQHVEQCRLKSAIHYLRTYPNETIGFVISSDEGEKQKLAIIQVARGPWVFADNVRWHWARALAERMVKIVIHKYSHVSFWNEK